MTPVYNSVTYILLCYFTFYCVTYILLCSLILLCYLHLLCSLFRPLENYYVGITFNNVRVTGIYLQLLNICYCVRGVMLFTSWAWRPKCERVHNLWNVADDFGGINYIYLRLAHLGTVLHFLQSSTLGRKGNAQKIPTSCTYCSNTSVT